MRNVIVTGGSRGLGFGIACRLASSGYRVIAIARRPTEALGAAMREAEAEGRGSVHFRSCDLGDIAAIPPLVKAVKREFGAIYGLVNNAALGTSGVLATLSDEQIEALVRLNTVSPLILTKYVLRAMMADGVTADGGSGREGRIVNIASIVGFAGFGGLSVYSATKASLLGFTRSLAREVGQLGITVNAVAPGFMDTEMTEGLGDHHRDRIRRRSALRRFAEIGDVADAVEFLMGDKARNITGTVLTIDAGSTA